MVTERARTLPTEPTEGEIAKSNSLRSFINIGQRGRMKENGIKNGNNMGSPTGYNTMLHSNVT